MKVANTLGYYDTATITAIKSFTVQTPVACTIRLFRNIVFAASKLGWK
jgi:hypothetical protein